MTTLNWNNMAFPEQFGGSPRAGCIWAKEKYLQKYLTIFNSVSDLSMHVLIFGVDN